MAISRQTEAPDEVIVVDNNSTDKSASIARSFEFVKLITEKRQGVLQARTTGFNAANSDIVGRIDADTLIDDDWVAQVKRLFANKRTAAVTGPVYWYDMPLKEKNYFAEHIVRGLLYKYDKDFPFLYGSNMAIRSEEWQQIKNQLCKSKKMHEDMDLAIHLYLNNRHIVYSPKMRAGASSRRFDSNLSEFYRYSELMRQTFDRHAMRPIGARIAMALYTFGYVTLYPLRRSYNDQHKKRSVKNLLRGNKPRKNPMD